MEHRPSESHMATASCGAVGSIGALGDASTVAEYGNKVKRASLT